MPTGSESSSDDPLPRLTIKLKAIMKQIQKWNTWRPQRLRLNGTCWVALWLDVVLARLFTGCLLVILSLSFWRCSLVWWYPYMPFTVITFICQRPALRVATGEQPASIVQVFVVARPHTFIFCHPFQASANLLHLDQFRWNHPECLMEKPEQRCLKDEYLTASLG